MRLIAASLKNLNDYGAGFRSQTWNYAGLGFENKKCQDLIKLFKDIPLTCLDKILSTRGEVVEVWTGWSRQKLAMIRRSGQKIAHDSLFCELERVIAN